jgi:transcriptional regulator
MYNPSYSKIESQSLALQLIRENPLGLLISTSNQKIQANYLPFIVSDSEEEVGLISHTARANPQWKNLAGSTLISFQGPQRYISPSIYKKGLNVPTWNYAAVQIQGEVQLVTDRKGIQQILNQSVTYFEKENQTSWSYTLPSDMQEKLEAAIIGIKIKILHIEAKFKLGQNRHKDDQEAVLNFLKHHTTDAKLYSWMLKCRATIAAFD